MSTEKLDAIARKILEIERDDDISRAERAVKAYPLAVTLAEEFLKLKRAVFQVEKEKE